MRILRKQYFFFDILVLAFFLIDLLIPVYFSIKRWVYTLDSNGICEVMMQKSYHLVFFMFTLFLLVGCVGSLSTFNSKGNPRLDSDPRLETPLNIRAVYPAWNSKMASIINETANYFYTIDDQSIGLTHKIAIYNLYSEEYSLQWFLDEVAIEDAKSTSFELSPTLFDEQDRVGDHLVKVELYNRHGIVKGTVVWLVRIVEHVEN